MSIPYGASKRKKYLDVNDGIYKISIPYGAIKRVLVIYKYVILQNFNSLWCD